jgi:hypothetical protein
MIVDLPTGVGYFPSRDLRRHVPKFFYDLRESGNRVSRPLEHFRPTFQNVNDQLWHEIALDWVFGRVEEYATRFIAAPGANPMAKLLQEIDDAFQNGDWAILQGGVTCAKEIFKAIANVIRPDRGFDYSDELFNEFLETARNFIQYFAFADPGMGSTFSLLSSVYTGGARDLRPIALLSTRSIGPNERLVLKQLVQVLATNGDILATDMWNNGLP